MTIKKNVEDSGLSSLIDVGEYKLHYQILGKGEPTVILDSGIGDSGSEMIHIAQKISEFTSVLCYDRLGLGKSDPFPKGTKIRTTVSAYNAPC